MDKDFAFEIGDIVQVAQIDRQPEKKDRISNFKGQIIKIKGQGLQKMFTVRAVLEGVGVDKIFPVGSPLIQDIKLIEKPKKTPRRARLFKQSSK